MIRAMNRWTESPPSELDQLVYQSRLVGADESLVLWGGGNNSVKTTSRDLLGQPIKVMFIKSSGSDMKTITPQQFPAVRLDYIAPLRRRTENMADDEMVGYLSRCLVDPASARPSIETLLHAFLPAEAVLHTHADAILSLTNTSSGEKLIRRCFGNTVAIVPYRRPGFLLSKDVADRFDEQPDAHALILMNHGLITWGATPREAYEQHIRIVSAAEEFVNRAPRVATTSVVERDRFRAHEVATVLRGAVSEQRAMILELDESDEVLAFLARSDVDRVSQVGAATPDHLLYTKRFPLFLRPDEDVRAAVGEYVRRYRLDYERYKPEFAMLDPMPRVVLIPGVGMFTTGKDARAARIVRDIYRHTIQVIDGAERLARYATLSDDDAFHAEYWPLELYKLSLLPKDKDLAGKVAIVTGAASGIGRAIAMRLAAEGAHVVVTDIDDAGAATVTNDIVDKYGLRRSLSMKLDVANETNVDEVVAATCRAYGGIDILISNAGVSSFGRLENLPLVEWEKAFAVNTRGHFLVARATLRVMREQRRGGSIVFNASKNVTAPGKEFGAYSVSKAAEAQLCRIVALEGGEYGIRANMLNPDAIFDGSRFWSDEMRTMRARSYGVDPSALPDFYRQRTLLGQPVTAEDVAEAALFLAGPRSAKTTGAMLPVDGGVKEAFPR